MKKIRIINFVISILLSLIYIIYYLNRIVQILLIIFVFIEILFYIIDKNIAYNKTYQQYSDLIIPLLAGISCIRFQTISIPNIYFLLSFLGGTIIVVGSYLKQISQNKKIKLIFILEIGICSISILGTILFSNTIFDTSIEETVNGSITDKSDYAGRGLFMDDYSIDIDFYYKGTIVNSNAQVDSDTYKSLKEGDKIKLSLRGGALKIPYYYLSGDRSIH